MDKDSIYKPIKKINITDSIIEQIKMSLFNKEFKLGDKLPSERELARKFDVGRPAVREAVRELCAFGLLEIKPGQGIFVKEINTETIISSIMNFFNLFLIYKEKDDVYHDIWYARLVLEPEIALLAARNCSEDDYQELEKILAESAECFNDPQEYSKKAQKFHKKLVETSGNEVFILLINALNDIIMGYSKERLYEPSQIELSYENHKKLLTLIKNGSEEEAKQQMKKHMEYTYKK